MQRAEPCLHVGLHRSLTYTSEAAREHIAYARAPPCRVSADPFLSMKKKALLFVGVITLLLLGWGMAVEPYLITDG